MFLKYEKLTWFQLHFSKLNLKVPSSETSGVLIKCRLPSTLDQVGPLNWSVAFPQTPVHPSTCTQGKASSRRSCGWEVVWERAWKTPSWPPKNHSNRELKPHAIGWPHSQIKGFPSF
jgi:hypothetical protein